MHFSQSSNKACKINKFHSDDILAVRDTAGRRLQTHKGIIVNEKLYSDDPPGKIKVKSNEKINTKPANSWES